jgi:hypothetical protein
LLYSWNCLECNDEPHYITEVDYCNCSAARGNYSAEHPNLDGIPFLLFLYFIIKRIYYFFFFSFFLIVYNLLTLITTGNDPYEHYLLYHLELGYAYHCDYCPLPPAPVGMLLLINTKLQREKNP